MNIPIERFHGYRMVLLCLSFSLLFSLPPLFYPPWGGLLGMLAPVPIGIAYIYGGWQSGTIVIFISSAVLGGLAGVSGLIFSLLEAGLTGLLLAVGMMKKLPYTKLIIMVSGIALLAQLTTAMMLTSASPSKTGAYIRKELERTGEMMTDYLPEEDGIDTTRFPIENYIEIFWRLYPGLLVVGVIMTSILCALIIGRIAAGKLPGMPSFTSWKLPDILIWFFLALFIIITLDYEIFWGIPANLVLVFSLLYAVQGASVALDFAVKRHMNIWIIYIFGLIFLLQPHLLVVLLVLGLLDFRYDFRRPKIT